MAKKSLQEMKEDLLRKVYESALKSAKECDKESDKYAIYKEAANVFSFATERCVTVTESRPTP